MLAVDSPLTSIMVKNYMGVYGVHQFSYHLKLNLLMCSAEEINSVWNYFREYRLNDEKNTIPVLG